MEIDESDEQLGTSCHKRQREPSDCEMASSPVKRGRYDEQQQQLEHRMMSDTSQSGNETDLDNQHKQKLTRKIQIRRKKIKKSILKNNLKKIKLLN